MKFTLESLVNSISGVLKQHFPGLKVYSNANQQGTVFPCFFVFFMPVDTKCESGRRLTRRIGIDLVYVTERNASDAYDRMVSAADILDNELELLTYTDGEGKADLWTFDREWKIDDGELHYQFTLKVMVSKPDGTPYIESVDNYEGGIIEDAGQSKRDRNCACSR